MPKKLKVFHGLVNYGTQAGLFARELRNQGIDAISVVQGDPSKRKTDIELLHGGTFIQKVFKHLWNRIRRYYWFFKYNTFHFYFGNTLFKNQRDLPFYRFFGKKVVMEYLGNDIRHYKTLVERYNLPESHDFYQRMEEHDNKIARRINHEKKYLDYKLCCLPTHMDFAKSYHYSIHEVLPLALNVRDIQYKELQKKTSDEQIKILHAPTNRSFKGTNYIESAIDNLQKEGYAIDFKIAEGITHAELFKEYERCDIFIDQISIGWYGTAALEAMAIGRPTCAFIDERYFQYIDYADEIPVINITRKNVTDQLRELLKKWEQFPEIGRKSREFVEKYHDVKNVTKKLIDIYQKKVWKE
jgi:glycosyltransferase involved in cell wall biosynthesis